MTLIPLPPPPQRHPVKRLFQGLGVLAALLILALIAGEPMAELNDQRHYPIPGRAVKMGEETLHLFVAGQHGSRPTIIIDGDLGLPSAAWMDLVKDLSQRTMVVAWDRPGYGWSFLGSQPHDGLSLVHQLHTALGTRDNLGPYVQNAETPGPYLLVGQGLGAAHMRIFAAEYPDEVAGMVLLDQRYPGDPRDALEARQSWLSSEVWKRRLMIRRYAPLAAPAWTQALSASEREAALAMLSRVDAAKAELAEITALDETLTQAQKVQSLGGKPLRVLTSDRGSDPTLSSRVAQDRSFAQLSTQGDHQVVSLASPFVAANELGQPNPFVLAIYQALGGP